MAKRYRTVEAKPGQLKVAYGKGDDGSHDLQYAWGGHGAYKPDALCLGEAIERCVIEDGKNLRKVLEERGYDITTLKFTVERAQ